MVEVTNELIYKLMLEIQGEQKAMRADIHAEQEALTQKVSTIATAMVSINKRLDDLDASNRLIAVAVDDHTHQFAMMNTRLERIEKKLNLTHA
jgi:tetrahydromethanopterin S-methyltransferase subunit G